ncbi:UNVERIFIED_CONTAM: hypothetical protein Sindi_2881500 [Sesamum indicum]
MTQAMAFAHNISLQCAVWRHDKILLEGKTVEMEKKILEQQALIESLQSEAQEKKELASKLEISEKELEEARSIAQTDRAAAFEASKEQGLAEGRDQGIAQGEIQKLEGFVKNFDLEQLDVSLDKNLEPYPPGPAPADDFPEFLPLMDDLPPPSAATAFEQPSTPTEIWDPIPREQVEVVEISEDHGLKRKRGKRAIPKAETATEPTESRSDPSSRSTIQGRLEAKLAADRVAEPESRKRFTTFQEAWQRMRDERPSSARSAEMSGEKWVPDWKISKNNSVLRTFAGQDSWKVYKTTCLERDQVILAQTSLTSLEKYFAHNMTQLTNKSFILLTNYDSVR